MAKVRTPMGVLLAAAVDVERFGLARDCFRDDDGGVCVVWALVSQLGLGGFPQVPWWEDDSEPPAIYAEAVASLAHHLGWPVWDDVRRTEEQLMAWNDTGAGSAQQVAEAMRSAAYFAGLPRLAGV